MTHPHIADAEWHVMNYIWSNPGASAQDIHAALGPAQGWAEGTIKSLLNRLLKKGALRNDRDGARFLYYPAVKREAVINDVSLSFLERLFDGNAGALVSHFVKQGSLSARDIAELRSLLNKGQP